jgi:uncharacterized protein (TIGR04551 family)
MSSMLCCVAASSVASAQSALSQDPSLPTNAQSDPAEPPTGRATSIPASSAPNPSVLEPSATDAPTRTSAAGAPGSANLRGENAARQREPYADAPGVTPIDEPVRATAAHQWPRVRFEGFYRVRGDLGYGWDLNRGPTPLGVPVWPAAYVDGGRSPLQTNADMRLRLDAEVHVGYGVTFRARLHALDNVRFGSLPDSDFVGGSLSQRAPSTPIDVRQLYGEVLLPIGVLRAGRMGSLVDWGTGFFVNAGNGWDDDFGDVGDRVSFTTSLGGLLWTLLYENSASGAGTDQVDGRVKPAFDLDPRDDVRTIALGVARWDTDVTRRRLLAASRTRLNFGVVSAIRWQDFDSAPGMVPSTRTVLPRGLFAVVGDAWARLDASWFTLEAELGMLYLSVQNLSLDPTIVTNVPVRGLQFGGVVRADFRGSPRLFGRVEFGFASGDTAPGFGARPQGITPPQPGDLDGPQFDITSASPDTTIDNFRFHPNYRVDLILFRRIIGMVTDAAYFRPMLRYRIGPMVTFEGAVIASMAVFSSSTPGGANPLGIEADVALNYEQEWGFFARAEYGLLLPLAGFADAARGVSPSPAHALRATLAYRF